MIFIQGVSAGRYEVRCRSLMKDFRSREQVYLGTSKNQVRYHVGLMGQEWKAPKTERRPKGERGRTHSESYQQTRLFWDCVRRSGSGTAKCHYLGINTSALDGCGPRKSSFLLTPIRSRSRSVNGLAFVHTPFGFPQLYQTPYNTILSSRKMSVAWVV